MRPTSPDVVDEATSKALGSLMSNALNRGTPRQDRSAIGSQDASPNIPLFHKTRACVYYESGRGCVHGENCLYAHGTEDLKTAPDLRKTTMCDKWLVDSCPLSSTECRFAHGMEDLRSIHVASTRSQTTTAASPTPMFDYHRREVMTPMAGPSPVVGKMQGSARFTATPPSMTRYPSGRDSYFGCSTPFPPGLKIDHDPPTPESESVDALTQLVGTLQRQHTQLQRTATCSAVYAPVNAWTSEDNDLVIDLVKELQLIDSALVIAQQAQILYHHQQQALQQAYMSITSPAAIAAASLFGVHTNCGFNDENPTTPAVSRTLPFDTPLDSRGNNVMASGSLSPFSERHPQMTPCNEKAGEKVTILLSEEFD